MRGTFRAGVIRTKKTLPRAPGTGAIGAKPGLCTPERSDRHEESATHSRSGSAASVDLRFCLLAQRHRDVEALSGIGHCSAVNFGTFCDAGAQHVGEYDAESIQIGLSRGDLQ